MIVMNNINKWRSIMKNMQIFEPAMCCDTGLCGVGVDPELLRISTVLNSLKKDNIIVERFNLTGSPQMFVSNKVVNKFVHENGVEGLPITLVEGEIVITGRYPTNEEFITLLELPECFLGEQSVSNSSEECCCCSDGECC
jgi:hypothetical protein